MDGLQVKQLAFPVQSSHTLVPALGKYLSLHVPHLAVSVAAQVAQLVATQLSQAVAPAFLTKPVVQVVQVVALAWTSQPAISLATQALGVAALT